VWGPFFTNCKVSKDMGHLKMLLEVSCMQWYIQHFILLRQWGLSTNSWLILHKTHWIMVKRNFHYLKGIVDFGLPLEELSMMYWSSKCVLKPWDKSYLGSSVFDKGTYHSQGFDMNMMGWVHSDKIVYYSQGHVSPQRGVNHSWGQLYFTENVNSSQGQVHSNVNVYHSKGSMNIFGPSALWRSCKP
jgi:hypothetical protein